MGTIECPDCGNSELIIELGSGIFSEDYHDWKNIKLSDTVIMCGNCGQDVTAFWYAEVSR